MAAAIAELVVIARRRGTRPKVQDTGIAPTAPAHGVPVCTQASNFDAFDELEVIRLKLATWRTGNNA